MEIHRMLGTKMRGGAVIAAAVVALSACGAGTTSPNSDSAEQSDGPIVIGAALGFTGLLEPYEREAFETAKMAVDDINADGGVLGRKLELITADTKSDPNLAATAASEVLEQGADVILTSDFDFGGPAAIVANEQGVVAMSLHASPPEFGPTGLGDLAFSAGIMTPNEAAVVAEWAYNEQGWRTAYELEDTSIAYTRSFHAAFREVWERLGGEIIGHDTWQNGDQSIASQISRIKTETPDFLLMTTYNPGGASAVRQIRNSGIELPIVSGQPMDGTYWLDAVPDLSNFYVSTYASFTGDDSDPFVNELRDRYQQETGEYPTVGYFVNGYNAIDLLAQGIEKAGTVEGDALASALETFDGNITKPLGETCFSEQWHVSLCRPFAIVEFVAGEPEFLARVHPAYVPDPAEIGD